MALFNQNYGIYDPDPNTLTPEELSILAQESPDYEAFTIPAEDLDELPDELRGPEGFSFHTFAVEDAEAIEVLDHGYHPRQDLQDADWDWECSECGMNAALAASNAPGGVYPHPVGANAPSLCCRSPLVASAGTSAVLIQNNAA